MTATPSRGYLFAALTVGIWCGFVLVSRFGGASALTPYDTVALRFIPAVLLLLPIWCWQRTPAQLFTRQLLTLALVGGLGYSLFVYSGFKHTPAAHAAILLPGILPFNTALFAWLLLGERPQRSRWIGLIVIAFGIALLAADTLAGGASLLGDGLIVCASLCWALYTVLVRRWQIAPWDATVSCALLTALAYLPIYALLLPKQLSEASWTLLITQSIYQGIIVVIVAMVLYMKAVAALGPSRVGALMALVPACAGILAVPLLNEPLSLHLIAGLILVSLGAFIGSRPTRAA